MASDEYSVHPFNVKELPVIFPYTARKSGIDILVGIGAVIVIITAPDADTAPPNHVASPLLGIHDLP